MPPKSSLAALLLYLSIASLAFAQYGDISGVKIARPEDKRDVQSTAPPRGAKLLFDGTETLLSVSAIPFYVREITVP